MDCALSVRSVARKLKEPIPNIYDGKDSTKKNIAKKTKRRLETTKTNGSWKRKKVIHHLSLVKGLEIEYDMP
jgi:hypothetical protein